MMKRRLGVASEARSARTCNAPEYRFRIHSYAKPIDTRKPFLRNGFVYV